ncbi:MAG: hypothetical protein Q9202_000494 [Teloschistes flavicans]
MASALDSGLSKLGQDLLLRSKAVSDAVVTYVVDERYRELRALDIAAAILTAATVYLSLLVLYRLLFSPIARFPGPKLAAATEWYEFYYQLVQNGQWGRQVDRLHDQYGPIVRITPWQLSIRDSSFYSQLYVAGSTRRTDMWARGREGSGFQNSHHLSVPHDLHRQRRKHLDTFFSRQGINRTEGMVADAARQLANRLEALKGTGAVVQLDDAFSALTGDIIAHVACGASPGLLEHPEFSPECVMNLIPSSVMERLYPQGISNLMVGKMGMVYIEKIKKELDENPNAKDTQVSVFHHLLTSDIPESERSTSRLLAESMVLIIAGTFTSAHTLSMIVYHALTNPKIEKRLRNDLKDVMAGYPGKSPRWADLEKVPYLQATIKEALRLYGLIGDVARCSPDVALQYKQWTIPKHTPVGMSINHLHTEASVFASPHTFSPERWLGNYNPQMDKNFVPFTKGSRSCLGVNLAYAELYLTTALLFRPGGPKLQLYQTDESDVRITRDVVIGLPASESRGVRVSVN